MICGSGGSKSRLAKAAGAEPCGQMRNEKMHAVVVRSTFRSQNVESTSCSELFWKLRCRKSARHCGARHISKSECARHLMLGPLLDVQMSFRMAGARDCPPCQKWANVRVLQQFQLQPPLHDTTLHYTTVTTTTTTAKTTTSTKLH